MKKVYLVVTFWVFLMLAGCIPAPVETPITTPIPDGEATFIDKKSPGVIRLFNYNVNWDSIFPNGDPQNHKWREADRSDAFRRLIAAVSPDVACIQEINPDRSPRQVSEIFDAVLPLEGGSRWQAISVYDTVIVSKYDLKTQGYELYYPPFGFALEQAAALVDLPDATYGQTDFYLICAHFASSGDQEDIIQRQVQADVLIRQARDLKTAGEFIDLASGTPFVFAGDFNVYNTDPAHHLETLITGDIVYEDEYGADVAPDWDDTWLTDSLPSHNGTGGAFYTWRDDDSNFDPYPLDRIIYSDSVMSADNSFVLNTRELSAEMLARYGLQPDDVLIFPESGTYDHLPMIVDFTLSEN